MKTARFVLKIIAGGLAVAALACAIVGWWDVIAGAFCKAKECAKAKKLREEEFSHYADI